MTTLRGRWQRARATASAPALVVSYGSAGVIVLVNVAALGLGPGGGARPVLLLCALMAGWAAYRSVTDDPRALTVALLVSVAPVVALLADGSPTWLVGPLAALLLVAGELNVLGWELRGRGATADVPRHRLAEIGKLGALGAAAALAIGLATPAPAFGGMPALLLAAVAFVVLAGVLFGRAV